MDRREFLASLGALALVGPSVVKAWDDSGHINRETFYLHETFVIGGDYILMTNCRFIAVGDWPGPMIELRGSGNTLQGLHLVDRRKTPGVGLMFTGDGNYIHCTGQSRGFTND